MIGFLMCRTVYLRNNDTTFVNIKFSIFGVVLYILLAGTSLKTSAS